MYYIEFQYEKVGCRYYAPETIGGLSGRIVLIDWDDNKHFFQVEDNLLHPTTINRIDSMSDLLIYNEEDMQFVGLEVTVADVSTYTVNDLDDNLSAVGIDLTSRNWPGTDKDYKQYLLEDTDDLPSGRLFDVTEWE